MLLFLVKTVLWLPQIPTDSDRLVSYYTYESEWAVPANAQCLKHHCHAWKKYIAVCHWCNNLNYVAPSCSKAFRSSLTAVPTSSKFKADMAHFACFWAAAIAASSTFAGGGAGT